MKRSIFRTLFMIVMLLMTICSISQEADSVGYIVKTGDMAPNFEMQLIDGRTMLLNDFRGKVVMLQFTASWCGVCRKEMPFIEKEIWQVHKDKDFIVIPLKNENLII